ncbi:MAG: hypothetical protein IJT98_09800 [Prevotella sp.]|nr:hypothetical protein [Prevotella sp.]
MKRIFGDKNEPLYGRSTSKLSLKPFSVSVIKQIFSDHCHGYKNDDLLCLYMITGGTPAAFGDYALSLRSLSLEDM